MMANGTTENNKFIFDWEIEHFRFITIRKGNYLASPVFLAEPLLTTSWFLAFYPKGCDSKGSDGFSSLFLCRTRDGVEKVCIGYKVELIVSEGKTLSSLASTYSEFLKGKSSGWTKCFNNIDDLHLNRMTIRCTMVLSGSSLGLSSKCRAVTKIGVNRYSFVWDVKVFNDSAWIERKVFPCSQNNIEVTLTAPMNCLNVRIKNMNSESCFIECKLFLLDVTEVEQISGKYSHSFSSDNATNILEFRNFITKDRLISKFIKNGCFTLKFEFSVCNGSICEEIEPVIVDNLPEVENEALKTHYITTLQEELQRMNTGHAPADINLREDSCAKKDTVSALQEDLERMFTNRMHTDVSLRTESKTFQTHKSLLSARSPVFTAMFEHDMFENQTGIVDIPDVEEKILDCFLKFMYTGVVDRMGYESASKLLVIADKYQVPTLIEECSSFLKSNITTENATDIVMLADMVGHEALKTHSVDYIISHAEIILPSDHWARFVQDNIKLATDIIFKFSVKYIGKKTCGE